MYVTKVKQDLQARVDTVSAVLRNVNELSALNEDNLSLIAKSMEESKYVRGDVIVRQGCGFFKENTINSCCTTFWFPILVYL